MHFRKYLSSFAHWLSRLVGFILTVKLTYSTLFMILQISIVTLFYAYQSIFYPPQRRRMIQSIVWEGRFGQHFRRSRELMSLKFCMFLFMLSLHYHLCGFYKDCESARSDIIWFYDSQFLSCPLKEGRGFEK